MIGITTKLVFHLYVLFAGSSTGGGSRHKANKRNQFQNPESQEKIQVRRRYKGRQRYAPSAGTKSTQKQAGVATQKDEALPTPPPLTGPEGPFPSLFTCRHTYEDTLMEEITRSSKYSVRPTSPCPGLVCVEGDSQLLDPVYALQSIPECRIVECHNSIKGLAKCIADIQSFQELLSEAPKGSLTIHALVPGMCKGQKDPILRRRSFLVADAVSDLWKKQFPAARKKRKKDGNLNDAEENEKVIADNKRLLLQIILFSPDVAAASLMYCQPVEFGTMDCVWPNPRYPVGMAKVDITTQKMPSSAYRKLLEAFGCWGMRPGGQETVVDLGASPGGWTAAVLLYCDDGSTGGLHVIAVDRSPLNPKLMKDSRVSFVQGDAFTFEPDKPVAWMVSDIIAYPERVIELLHHWCGKQLASNMIITMKFQGSTPSWTSLDEAIRVAQSYHYSIRAKHFFNNKNEVTLMLQQKGARLGSNADKIDLFTAIPSFYRTGL
jgi:hypothetical protein